MKTSKPAPEPQPIINPTAVYRTEQLRQLLHLAVSTLRSEKRAGRLRYSRRAGKDFFLGRWVLDWIEAGAVSSPEAKEG
jgi:hypothetical protein